jgi:hypothetical protein
MNTLLQQLSFGITPTQALLALMSFLLVGVLLLQIRSALRIRTYTIPVYKKAIQTTEEKAKELITKATQEAESLRTKVQSEIMQATKSDEAEVTRILKSYDERLAHLIDHLSSGLDKENARATLHFIETLQKMEAHVASDAKQTHETMKASLKQSGELFDRLSGEIQQVEDGIKHLMTALVEAATDETSKNVELVREEMRKIGVETASSVTSVAKNLEKVLEQNLATEFASISTDVEKYRRARLELVDERILVIIEKTAQIALQKELSIQQQSELVYRALEEAKQTGIFV